MQEDYLEQKKKEKAKADKKKEKKIKQKLEEEQNEDMEIFLPGGTCLKFSNEKNENIKYRDIKDALIAVDESREIAFVEYQNGCTEGYIRFLIENDAKEYIKKLTDNKLTIKDTVFEFALLEGEAEREYLDTSAKNIKQRLKEGHARRMNSRRGGHRGGHRRGRFDFNDRKRKHDDANGNGKTEDDAGGKTVKDQKSPTAKVARTDDGEAVQVAAVAE
jgi:hypothetical protein